MPHIVNYSAAISACEEAALWQLALGLLARMPRVGLEPDAVICSAAIRACGNAAQWQLALGLLTRVPRVGLESGTVSYAAAVSACEKAAVSACEIGPRAPGAAAPSRLAASGMDHNVAISACKRPPEGARPWASWHNCLGP
eukprot:11219094-Lingulodinium_polyedra.AAC.1